MNSTENSERHNTAIILLCGRNVEQLKHV